MLNLQFPEDYGKAELAGKDVEFTVTVNSIDETRRKQNEVITAIMDNSEILKYPEKELNNYIENQKTYTEYMASMYGMDMDAFAQANGFENEEAFDTYLKVLCEQITAQEMLLKSIALAEGLTLSDKEYEEGKVLILSEQGYDSEAAYKEATGQDFEEMAGKGNIELSLLMDKAMELVLAEAVEISE